MSNTHLINPKYIPTLTWIAFLIAAIFLGNASVMDGPADSPLRWLLIAIGISIIFGCLAFGLRIVGFESSIMISALFISFPILAILSTFEQSILNPASNYNLHSGIVEGGQEMCIASMVLFAIISMFQGLTIFKFKTKRIWLAMIIILVYGIYCILFLTNILSYELPRTNGGPSHDTIMIVDILTIGIYLFLVIYIIGPLLVRIFTVVKEDFTSK